MAEYKYLRGSRDSREAVEYDITRRGQYITTCVVDIDLLICGVKAFPCGNGDDEKLTAYQRLEILELVQAERKKITDSYPVKTLKGWQESGLRTFKEYCFPGDKVDDDMVQHFVDSVPPILMLTSCTQGGEAYSLAADESGGYKSTYITFHDLGGGYWQFDGYCFYKENVNRCADRSRLEERIEEARREVETHGD